jgi:hypothetical protein
MLPEVALLSNERLIVSRRGHPASGGRPSGTRSRPGLRNSPPPGTDN